jgi:hypothetical protein
MSLATIVAVAIVAVASIATAAIGAAYQWQVTSRGYAIWTRVVGVAAVLGLSGVTAWSRHAQPIVALAIVVGGVALAVWFVWMHVRLTARIRASLGDEPIR